METKTRTLRATFLAAKILEAGCAAVLLAYAVLLVMALAAPQRASDFLGLMADKNHGEMSVMGFDIMLLQDGNVIGGSVAAFAVAGIISFACQTMVFRNIRLILNAALGRSKSSSGATPFQKDTVRMVREIGIIYILMPVMQAAVSVIFRLAAGAEAETYVRMEGIVTGLVIIALSQIFAYGEALEGEVEGLL